MDTTQISNAKAEGMPKPFDGKDEWMLGENIPDIDLFFSQIFLSEFVNDTSYPFLKNYTETLSCWKGFGMDFYFGRKDSYEVGESILKALIERPGFAKELNKNIVNWSKKLIFFSKQVFEMDLSHKTDPELFKLYEKNDQIHTKLYTYGWLPVALDMFHNNFTNALKKYLRTVCQTESETEEVFVTLCTPSKKTIIAKERGEFLAILQKNLSELKKSAISPKPTMSFALRKRIEKHSEKWGHLGCNFTGQAAPFGAEHYFKEMIDFVKAGFSPGKVADQEKRQLLDAKAKKNALYKQLKISAVYRNLFEAANDFALTKLVRRDAQLRNMLFLHRSLLLEISKRLQISREGVQMMLKDELREALVNGHIDRNLISARLTEPFVFWTKMNFERVFTGKEAEVLRSGIKTTVDQTITEFKGQTAQRGYAKGPVKIIIRATDMHKMNDGDILVSIATDPDIVPAMKKAAAIVTEQGGITSHAAIVSRELGTPCVIGTKIATKILKDGMMVEVDANKGLVRIIK